MNAFQFNEPLQNGKETNPNEDDAFIESRHNELAEMFKAIMEDIRNNEKMHQYLVKIDIIYEELLASYTNILSSNEHLLLRSKSNTVIKYSARTYFQFLIDFLKAKDKDKLDSKGRIVWYLEVEAKLHCCLGFFHNLKLEKDITNSPRQDYPKVWSKIHFEKTSNSKELKKEYKSMKKMLHIATSASLNEQQHQFAITKKLRFGLSFSKYFIMNDSAKLKSFLFYRAPTIEMAQKIWNIPEMGVTKEFSKIAYEGIKTNMKIYIPIDGKFDKSVNIFEEAQNTITVRVLYNKKFIKFPEFEKTGCMTAKNEGQTINQIIVHMHGGGFVALSSRSMQNHTRKWANELGLPIFSIDYRMPPEHPFPQAPQDCFVVYRFITQHIHHYLNVRPTSVYLAGDSAGGNLACSLTGLILKNQELIPKGVYAVYPAADLRYIFTPSRLHAITDPLLWPSMLLLCLNSYMNGNFERANDPLASPVLLTEEFVSGAVGDQRFPLEWPKTIITAGSKDPLYDDSLVLMQRMVESDIDCECIVYEELSHGYLSTDLFVKQCAKTVSQSIDHLRKLIGP